MCMDVVLKDGRQTYGRDGCCGRMVFESFHNACHGCYEPELFLMYFCC